jgi:tetratricopeptide (TPR) repeat protein
MFGLALALALQACQPDPLFAHAESLLAARDLPAARRAAERLDRARPGDPRVLTLLGRIWLAWPVFGRWQADSLLTRAGELDPDDPEPFYYLGLAGMALRGGGRTAGPGACARPRPALPRRVAAVDGALPRPQ